MSLTSVSTWWLHRRCLPAYNMHLWRHNSDAGARQLNACSYLLYWNTTHLHTRTAAPLLVKHGQMTWDALYSFIIESHYYTTRMFGCGCGDMGATNKCAADASDMCIDVVMVIMYGSRPDSRPNCHLVWVRLSDIIQPGRITGELKERYIVMLYIACVQVYRCTACWNV